VPHKGKLYIETRENTTQRQKTLIKSPVMDKGADSPEWRRVWDTRRIRTHPAEDPTPETPDAAKLGQKVRSVASTRG